MSHASSSVTSELFFENFRGMIYSINQVLTKQFTFQTPKKMAENTLKYSCGEQKILNRKAINEKREKG